MRCLLRALVAACVLTFPAYGSEFGRSWFELEPYKPSYFLFGKPDTKVQFSAKLRFVRTFPLFFAYSQQMKWELFLASAPFRDVNYEPELFYRWFLRPEAVRTDDNPEPPEWLDWIIYTHESNGRDGDESRSWDRAGIRYVRGWRLGSGRTTVIASVRMNIPIRLDPATPRFLWYRGIFECDVSLVRFLSDTFEDSELRLRFFSGGPSHIDPIGGGQELTLRLKPRSSWFIPTIVAQVFHGYGENLLDYDRKRFEVRVGLGL